MTSADSSSGPTCADSMRRPDFEAAARTHRRCRQNGVTPRGLVAAVAWRHDDALLAYDIDLARVAGVVRIEMDTRPGSGDRLPDRGAA